MLSVIVTLGMEYRNFDGILAQGTTVTEENGAKIR